MSYRHRFTYESLTKDQQSHWSKMPKQKADFVHFHYPRHYSEVVLFSVECVCLNSLSLSF